jgi:hypothetical protein
MSCPHIHYYQPSQIIEVQSVLNAFKIQRENSSKHTSKCSKVFPTRGTVMMVNQSLKINIIHVTNPTTVFATDTYTSAGKILSFSVLAQVKTNIVPS